MLPGLKRQNRLGSVLCKWDHTGPYKRLPLSPSLRFCPLRFCFAGLGSQCFSQAASTVFTHLGHLWYLGVPGLEWVLFSTLGFLHKCSRLPVGPWLSWQSTPKPTPPSLPPLPLQIEPIMPRVSVLPFKRPASPVHRLLAPDTYKCHAAPPGQQKQFQGSGLETPR